MTIDTAKMREALAKMTSAPWETIPEVAIVHLHIKNIAEHNANAFGIITLRNNAAEMLDTIDQQAARIAALEAENSIWQWLANHTEIELRYFGFEGEDEWQAYAVHGGRNDREWTLLGTGGTPVAALNEARTALGEQP